MWKFSEVSCFGQKHPNHDRINIMRLDTYKHVVEAGVRYPRDPEGMFAGFAKFL